MHTLTKGSLEKTITQIGRALKLLKQEQKEAKSRKEEYEYSYAIPLLEHTYIPFCTAELRKLKKERAEEENVTNLLVRDIAEQILTPIQNDSELLAAAKLLAKYTFNPGKKGPNMIGLERMSLISSNSKNKNIFQAWQNEWDRGEFCDNELGAKKTMRCDACRNQSSQSMELKNTKTGARLVFNYECFDNFSNDIGVKLGGRITSVRNALQEASDQTAIDFMSLLQNTLDEIKPMRAQGHDAQQIELPAEYNIFKDEDKLIKFLKKMYGHFKNEPDFTTGQKEFESNTGLRRWIAERLEDPSIPPYTRNAHEKFMALSKMTLAEKIVFIHDYKMYRPISILSCKPALDDIFLSEREKETDTTKIQHLFKSRITPAVAEQIEEHYDYKTQRTAKNKERIERYGEGTIDMALQRAIPIFFKDRQEWRDAFSKHINFEQLNTILNADDYALIKDVCQRLTLGYSSQMPADYNPADAREKLINDFPILSAQQIFRGLEVLERKLECSERPLSEPQKAMLQGKYIPTEDFHEFTDIDKRFSIETVIDRIEHSLVLGHKHAHFLEKYMGELKQTLQLGLISTTLTYDTDGDHSITLNKNQISTLNEINTEIEQLDDEISDIKVPQKHSQHKVEQKQKRDELTAQKDELLIKRYFALKGDIDQYTLRDSEGRRIDKNGILWTSPLEDAFNTVKGYIRIGEAGAEDLADKIDVIARLLAQAPVFRHVINLNEHYLNPYVLKQVKYVDENGAELIKQMHAIVMAMTKKAKTSNISIHPIMTEFRTNCREKYCWLVQSKTNVLEVKVFDENLDRYKQKHQKIETINLENIAADVSEFNHGIFLKKILEDSKIYATIYDDSAYDTILRAGARADFFKQFVHIAKTESVFLSVHKEIYTEIKQIAEDLPYYAARNKRADIFRGLNIEERSIIQNRFLDAVRSAIDSVSPENQAVYWRIINGTSSMYHDANKHCWKEGPQYNREMPDKSYWKENLMRFIDQTQPDEMNSKRKHSYWRLGELIAGNSTKYSLGFVEEKLDRHLAEKNIASKKQLEFFKNAAHKMEALVNDVLLKAEFMEAEYKFKYK